MTSADDGFTCAAVGPAFLAATVTAGTERWRKRLTRMTLEELRVTGEAIVQLPFFTPGTVAAAYHASLMEILAAELATRGVTPQEGAA